MTVSRRSRLSRLRGLALLLAVGQVAWLVSGCAGGGEPDEIDFSRLVPVDGVVRVNGQTAPGLVVTFLPKQWAASNGETAEDGSFSLETARRPGAFPGEYKVAISYLVSADGEPQGMEARGSMTPSPGMATAEEKLPPKYSSLDHTELSETVGPDGGTFEFDLVVEDFDFATVASPEEPTPDESDAAESDSDADAP